MAGKSITRETMPETMYRASRFCRTLGNPTAYLILRSLGKARKTPSGLSVECGLPLQTVSRILRDLRLLEAVRYKAKGNVKQYWIKNPEITKMLEKIEEWVDTERERTV